MSTSTSKIAAMLASAGILAAGWAVGTANGQTVAAGISGSGADPTATTPTTAFATASRASATASASSSSSASASASASASSSSASYADGTYTGTTATHRYGSVTVTVTITNGAIADVTADVVDDGEAKSKQINTRAIPTIKARVVAANSAAVATVSGATYTTDAYLTSLQAALAQAA